MGIVIGLSREIGFIAAQALVREIQRQAYLPRVPRYVDIDSKGEVVCFSYGHESIGRTTYMEWDKAGPGDPDDVVVSVAVYTVTGNY